jgi:microcystin-dependent protein
VQVFIASSDVNSAGTTSAIEIRYGGAGGYPATVFSMDNTGGNNYHENRPPYYSLAYIMRVS